MCKNLDYQTTFMMVMIQYGNTMANKFHEDEFDMSGSISDVYDCGNEESAVSSIWVKGRACSSV